MKVYRNFIYLPSHWNQFTHPVTGEAYSLCVQTWVAARTGRAQVEACVNVFAWQGPRQILITRYELEPLAPFSAFALAAQYDEMAHNWIIAQSEPDVFSLIAYAFRDGTGPTIKVYGRELRDTVAIVRTVE